MASVHPVETESRFDSFLSERKGRDLAWRDLSFKVVKKKGEAVILNNTFGSLPGGKVCCILGPSGAGKSSLLNVLAGRVSSSSTNQIQGEVTVDGKPISPTQFRSQIAYVMQDDAMFPTLTPREALRFSAALRIPDSVSKSKKEGLVNQILKELGLTECADTIIGGPLIKGISGGERKRTSVGVELVTNPAMVFLDEPTSGLDSYSAHQCVDLLKKVAQAGSSVLCTIHQPSSDVFNMFDHCILLKSARIVYHGSVENVNPHFEKIGFPVPNNFNPADHIMDVVQRMSVTEMEEKQLFASGGDAGTATSASFEAKVIEANHKAGFVTELKWLVWRERLGIRRDVQALVGRFAITTFLGLLLGLIFENAGGRDDRIPSNFSSHFGGLTFMSINAMFGTAQATLLAFPFERPIFIREYSNGTYKAPAYLLSKVFTEVVLAFCQNLLLVTLTYFLMDLDGNFILLVLVLWLLGLASASVAMFVGSAASDPKAATEAAPLLFVPQILFAGFFIRSEQIPVWMRWSQWLCSLKYAVNLVILNEFSDCDGYEEVCQQLKDDNDIDGDLWWFYVVVLFLLFIVGRLASLVVLTQKAKKFL